MIPVGAAPRQVVFSPDGTRAYVTTARAVQEINTATGRVVGTVPDPAGPQGIAVTPDGRSLYVTNPRSGDVWEIATGTGAVIARIPAGAQPWAVAVGPGLVPGDSERSPGPGGVRQSPGPGGGQSSGAAVYVTEINSDSVAVIAASSRRVVRTVGVGRLPASVAVTPDGAQVWAGNDMSGTISVISTVTGNLTATIAARSGTGLVDAGPLGIAFGRAR
jgi:YVTN family beta-propeller protein